MTESIEPTHELTATMTVRRRVRVNIAKTATKGYTHDTTAELEWEGDFGAASFELADLLDRADSIAREEIRQRELRDGMAP